MSASTDAPGPDQQQAVSSDGGGAGAVGRPGSVSPLHVEEIEDERMQDTTSSRPSRDWRDDAVCRETDPELFFPAATHGRLYEAQVAAAKAVCARCPVRAQCLDDAVAGMPVGIAGGLTERERRSLRRGRGAQRRGDERREQARELTAQRVPTAQVASRLGVSTRTVERWVAVERTATTSAAGGQEAAS